MEYRFKILHRAIVLECYANKPARSAIGEVVDWLKDVISEMFKYALKHNASQKTLHRSLLREV